MTADADADDVVIVATAAAAAGDHDHVAIARAADVPPTGPSLPTARQTPPSITDFPYDAHESDSLGRIRRAVLAIPSALLTDSETAVDAIVVTPSPPPPLSLRRRQMRVSAIKL